MLSKVGSAITFRRLLFATGLAVVVGVLVSPEPEPCDPRFHDFLMEHGSRSSFIGDVMGVRAKRWFATHPEGCPTMLDVTTPDELRVHRIAHLELVCGDGQYRRIYAMNFTEVPRNPLSQP